MGMCFGMEVGPPVSRQCHPREYGDPSPNFLRGEVEPPRRNLYKDKLIILLPE